MERDDASLTEIKRLEAAWEVLNGLEKTGFEAFLVGGCVRDMLLGESPRDYDIATNALPEQVQAIFARTIPTGIHHGTISVLIEKERLEVTTYRKESGYVDGRRPMNVDFVMSLEEDLARRDFTMNAMAMGRNGKIRDPFHGKEDLEAKTIRAVGNPADRFQEDALRMLRAIRFASQLDGEIEGTTWEGICLHADRMEIISRERIRDEWNKISTSNLEKGMRLLITSRLLRFVFPKLQQHPAIKWLAAAAFANQLSERAGIRHAALFWKMGLSTEEAAKALRQLRQSRTCNQSICSILRAIPDSDPLSWTSKQWADCLFEHGRDTVFYVMQIIGRSRLQEEELLLAKFNHAVEKQPIWSIRDLLLTGSDLRFELQIPAGPMIGQILQKLVEDVLEHPDHNTREWLLERAAIHQQTINYQQSR